MGELFEISADLYKFWHLDLQKNTIKIVCQDGRVLEDELQPEFSHDNPQVASSTFDWEKWWIVSTTTLGDVIITGGFNPNSPPPFHKRPSVYLDQNHWRTVTDVLQNPNKDRGVEEFDAARELVRLATDGGLVLPLSMGHMLETTGLHSERRYQVGVSMASLSGGWQIRNPLDIWKWEAERTIREHFGIPTEEPFYPIVTEPGALFGLDSGLGIANDASDIDKFMAMLTMPNVILSVLLDPERVPKHSLTKWIEHHARITSQMDSANIPKGQRRQLARRRYWNENISFYTAPYSRLSRLSDFPTFSDRELADLLSASPMVGLLAELFVRRFVDRKNKWRQNDLMDIFHLSSAAAYADYVCAETHTGTQLRDAQRSLGRTETVFTSLSDLVAAVRRDGATAESERLSGTARL